jgi:hypothetical protein
LFLIILSIVTAALFQFMCTSTPIEIGPNSIHLEYVEVLVSALQMPFRLLFFPIIILVMVWTLNRFLFRKKPRWRAGVSEFCYSLAIAILHMNILLFTFYSFFPNYLQAEQIGLTYILLVSILFPLGLLIMYSYEVLFINTMKIRTRTHSIKIKWLPILFRTIGFWSFAFAIN